jgi:hypothetical protein
MNSAEMRFFWILLSMMKCSGVPFTHICEWKSFSPYYGSSASPDWNLVAATMELGSASMICFSLYGSRSDSDFSSDSEAFTLAIKKLL